MNLQVFPFNLRPSLLALAVVLLASRSGWAGDDAFLVTYSHQMEDAGHLEFATRSVTGKPGAGSRFIGTTAEFEYSLTGWWTSSMYLDGQATRSQSTVYTGYRWENRFRLLPHERWINPVFYVEFAKTDGADKTLLDVVGRDGKESLMRPNHSAQSEKNREMEAKLILGSTFKGWTVAENLVAEKNLGHEPFEFGYTVGVSRPLAGAGKPNHCNVCASNVQVGVEMYGGLGTHDDLGLRGTSHYVAPAVAWTLASGATFRVSPGFGLTGSSSSFLLRFGLSYEIDEFGRVMRNVFHRQASTAAVTP